MNTLFNDNANAKYSTKDLKGGYRQQHLFIAESTLRWEKTLVKIQLQNIFKDHHIAAQPTFTTVGHYSLPFGKKL